MELEHIVDEKKYENNPQQQSKHHISASHALSSQTNYIQHQRPILFLSYKGTAEAVWVQVTAGAIPASSTI